MREPPDYFTFEERQEVREAQQAIEAMVAPTIEDVVQLL